MPRNYRPSAHEGAPVLPVTARQVFGDVALSESPLVSAKRATYVTNASGRPLDQGGQLVIDCARDRRAK